MLVYDIEIKKAIASKNEDVRQGIEYCEGWHDHKNMGISCICAYDYYEKRYRAFCADNIAHFYDLADQHDTLVGFNNIGFDNRVIVCNMPSSEVYLKDKSYDILREIWIGAGIGPVFKYPSHAGYGLDAVVKSCGLASGKTGHGAVAPVDYQRGNYGALIDYCLADVWLTKKLLDLIIETGMVINPKTQKAIAVRKPF